MMRSKPTWGSGDSVPGEGREQEQMWERGWDMLRGCSSVETEQVEVRPEFIREALRGRAEGWCGFKCDRGSQIEEGESPDSRVYKLILLLYQVWLWVLNKARGQ